MWWASILTIGIGVAIFVGLSWLIVVIHKRHYVLRKRKMIRRLCNINPSYLEEIKEPCWHGLQKEIDSNLAILAGAFQRACGKEEEILRALNSEPSDYVAKKLKGAKKDVEYRKKAFWAHHALAKELGFRVHGKHTEYTSVYPTMDSI